MSGRIFSVYKITGYGLTYYGSTKNTLNRRKNHHKSDYKNYKLGKKNYMYSYEILDQGDDWDIELVEIVEDENELLTREKYYIKNYECINLVIPGRTEEEKKEYDAQWYQDNKEYKKEKMAQWYQDNKEYKKEYDAQYREANKDHIKEQRAQYREKNLEKIKAKQRERLNCPHCAKEICKSNLSRHIKTQHKE